jgi:menaquinone-specific isochorismate synthase
VQALATETTRLADVRQLIPFLDARNPLVWLRKGQGIAGIGEAARLEFRGPTRVADAAAAWRELVASSTVRDELRMPGTGLVAFGTFAFADDSDAVSVLIVPEVIIGRRDGVSWITRVRRADAAEFAALPDPTPFGAEYRLTMLPGALAPDGYRAAVASAIERIAHGDLRKVVLARDVRAHLPFESDVRRALVELALGYPDCWTYAVDGLMGSSPETLARVEHGAVTARVLAGTTSRGSDAHADRAAAAELLASAKDRGEHDFAVQSVIEALQPHTSTLATSAKPFTLKLPNLWHLATDVAGTLGDGSTSLDLVGALHPTAAVAGTPREAALAVLDELEPFDRGRYAGPVGWIDAAGDGEWAIALRGAQLDADGYLTAYAGCGIVADSVPERELAETRMKFRPIVEAFG